MKLPIILAATVSMALIGVAKAALLEDVHGGVRVNRGNGYIAVRGDTEVKPGNMVMVDAKGGAQLVYPDGCDVIVKAGSATVIGAKSPCSQCIPNAERADLGIEGPGTESSLCTAAMVVGAVGLVGGAAGAALAGTNPTLSPFIPARPASP
jgi:hypothetical protein